MNERRSRRTLSRLRGRADEGQKPSPRGDQPKGWWVGGATNTGRYPAAYSPCVGHPPPTTLSRGPPSPVNGRGTPTASLIGLL